MLIFSEKDAECGIGWTRTGKDIAYFSGSKKKKKRKQLYTLTVTHEFKHTGDKCYFACSFPYTYTQLQEYLLSLQHDTSRRTTFRRRTLCKTLAGNSCDLLTITEKTDSLTDLQEREGILLTARVHPGETNASWIMHGILDFLTSQDEEAKALR